MKHTVLLVTHLKPENYWGQYCDLAIAINQQVDNHFVLGLLFSFIQQVFVES